MNGMPGFDGLIRPARALDAPAAGELLTATLGASADVLFGGGEHARAVERLALLFAQPGHRMSWQWARVAEVGDQVAGLLLSLPGARLDALSLDLLAPMLRLFRLPALLGIAWRGLPLVLGREAQPDEYYIAHIAVSPARRRQGIATALLAQADDLAAENGLRKLSLIVDRQNHPARRVYDRIGFNVVRVVRQPWVPARYHFTGYERRVKVLHQEEG